MRAQSSGNRTEFLRIKGWFLTLSRVGDVKWISPRKRAEISNGKEKERGLFPRWKLLRSGQLWILVRVDATFGEVDGYVMMVTE